MVEKPVEFVVVGAGLRPEARRDAGGDIALDQIGGIAGERPDIGVQRIAPQPALTDLQLGADAVEPQHVPMGGASKGDIKAFQKIIVEDHVILKDQSGFER